MNESAAAGAGIRPSALALTPLLVFLALFFGAGVYFTYVLGHEDGFYQLKAPVAILPALALAAFIAWRRKLKPLETLLAGMGDHNVVLMCLIFLLAGGFVEVSKAIGAVDAIVALGIGHLHPALLLPGLFVVAGFISLSLGTSMGTIAAVAPIALGVSDASGLDRALVLGAVIGGATFGDNLSVISDTAIVASLTTAACVLSRHPARLSAIDRARGRRPIDLPVASATDNRDHPVANSMQELIDHVESYDRLLTDILNAHLAQVSVQQNSDMRKISAWVAIAAVPTMLAGIYGMNFENMPELRWHYGYYAVLAVMVAICAGLYRAFKKSGWL